MATNPPQAVPLSPQALQFQRELAAFLSKHGVRTAVVAFTDPMQPTISSLVATPGAMDALRAIIEARFQFPTEASIREKLEAEFAGATGWGEA